MLNFFMRKMIEQKLKDVPAADREKIITLVTKNPALFQKIALEAQAEMKNGTDQMAAMMKVMERHKNELQALLGNQEK